MEPFNRLITGNTFDFISIDGPYGDATGQIPFSRVYLIPHLPGCLAKSFCIVIDDFQRQGEKNTVELIKNILSRNDIKYKEAVYSGSKDMFLIASTDLSWLCTM